MSNEQRYVWNYMQPTTMLNNLSLSKLFADFTFSIRQQHNIQPLIAPTSPSSKIYSSNASFSTLLLL
jgi:hypothetical protein